MITPTNTPFRNIFAQPFWYNPMDKLFRNSFFGFWNIPETLPSVNIRNEKDNYKIELAVPGLKKEDFIVDIDRNMLIVASEREFESHDERPDAFSRREYNYSHFSRRIPLPEDADVNRITARYNNGILSIGISKKADAIHNRNQRIKIE